MAEVQDVTCLTQALASTIAKAICTYMPTTTTNSDAHMLELTNQTITSPDIELLCRFQDLCEGAPCP